MDDAFHARNWLEVFGRSTGKQSERPLHEQILWDSLNSAAQLGNSEAEYQIGDLYERGWIVPRDLSQAARYYEQAAACDVGKAEYRLGAFHESGVEYLKSWNDAATWYRRAADHGVVDAYGSLALIAFNGHTGTRSISEAIKMFGMAGRMGNRNNKYEALALILNPRLRSIDDLHNLAAQLANADTNRILSAGSWGSIPRLTEDDLHCGLPAIGFGRSCQANERPH